MNRAEKISEMRQVVRVLELNLDADAVAPSVLLEHAVRVNTELEDRIRRRAPGAEFLAGQFHALTAAFDEIATAAEFCAC